MKEKGHGAFSLDFPMKITRWRCAVEAYLNGHRRVLCSFIFCNGHAKYIYLNFFFIMLRFIAFVALNITVETSNCNWSFFVDLKYIDDFFPQNLFWFFSLFFISKISPKNFRLQGWDRVLTQIFRTTREKCNENGC